MRGSGTGTGWRRRTTMARVRFGFRGLAVPSSFGLTPSVARGLHRGVHTRRHRDWIEFLLKDASAESRRRPFSTHGILFLKGCLFPNCIEIRACDTVLDLLHPGNLSAMIPSLLRKASRMILCLKRSLHPSIPLHLPSTFCVWLLHRHSQSPHRCQAHS